MRRWILGAALLAALGALGALVTRPARHDPPPVTQVPTVASAQPPDLPPAPPSAEELALLSPVAPGSRIAGFQVREIQGVRDGVLRVVCVKDKAVVRLDVALLDEDGVVPPATAGKFAVFYSLRSGALPEEGDALARKLADVIKAHTTATPPPGMTKFKPMEKPGVVL